MQLLSTGANNVISTAEAGANTAWSDAELHASMIRHFSRWRDLPQWAVWLFHARLHDIGPNLYGIMFDQQGKQRQGCAVFYAGIGGTSADAAGCSSTRASTSSGTASTCSTPGRSRSRPRRSRTGRPRRRG